ncbi:sigma-70 family RNA polymerase sigma factor [Mycoplasma sp. ATU-Cv-508]|uniref:sigma-70 family RNA polymerase sigma factor n=1 Tax=Mycoplasma sp. ATU-Cv-508 TaxID=2048001 RepID=UPI000FDE404D
MEIEKITALVSSLYARTLEVVIHQVLALYRQVPLTYEDAHLAFCAQIPWLIFRYRPQFGLSFKTFLALKCKFMVRTLAKSYSTKNYRLLNEAYSLNDSESAQEFVLNLDESSELDLSVLSVLEKKVYELHFVKSLSLKKVGQTLGLSYARIKTLIKSLKSKVNLQVKSLYN